MSISKPMVLSWKQTGARLLVTRYFEQFIATGRLILLEDEGTTLSFEGMVKKSNLEVSLRVHNPQFYWKIATRGHLGVADAYVDGDFSLVDKNYGLVNLFMIFTANTELNDSMMKSNSMSGWWSPLILTTGLASAISALRHVLKQNTLTQARRNISRHYDLGNEVFSLLMDEPMVYSCAIFEGEGEELKVAQLRKISRLIEKAKISKEHHILEIGFGWGFFAIEAVKRTGCKYTGITLSIEQLKYAQAKAKEAGLQDHDIQFILCDYRQLPKTSKFDRIIAVEMIEHVGHEYIDGFFSSCDSLLEEDGLLVLQFISIKDDKYEEYRKSPGFMKEYIFHGGCLFSLNRLITAMTAGSGFGVDDVESIGIHYYQTIRYWRDNFLKNQSLILELGFDEKFIRTWIYYFDYCAAGYKSGLLGDYQIVFSRPTNAALSGNPSVDGSF